MQAVSPNTVHQKCTKQGGAAVEGPPAMGPSLQLSTCMLVWGFLGLFVPAAEGTKPRSSSVIGQQAAKLWGFFTNNAISRRDLDL